MIGGRVDDAPSTAVAVSSDVDYDGLLRLAAALVPTGFLPEHIKQPGQAVAIILAGRELGMMPMQALRSLRMVKGNVTEAADSQLARFKQDGGRADWIRLDEDAAILHLRMRNGDETTSTFTMKDAERAGLTRPDRNGGPSMYTKFPKALLRSRAITQGIKDLGWSGGIGVYDPAELVSIVDAPETAPRVRVVSSDEIKPTPRREEARPAYVDDDGVDNSPRAMSIDDARTLPIYGRPDRWNGNGGKPIGSLPLELVDSARKFFRDLLVADPNAKNAPRLREQVDAMDLVLAERDAALAAAAAQQTDAFDASDELNDAPALPPAKASPFVAPATADDPAGATYAGDPYPTPAAAPARELPDDRNRWSTADLQKRVLELLEHPSIGDAFRRQMSLTIETGVTKAELVLAESDLVAMIGNAPKIAFGGGTAPAKRTRTSTSGVSRPS